MMHVKRFILAALLAALPLLGQDKISLENKVSPLPSGTQYAIPYATTTTTIGWLAHATGLQCMTQNGAAAPLWGACVTLQATTPGTAQTGNSNITGTAIAGAFSGPLTGNVTGNASGSASTLATPRAINGVNFDGSAPITVTADANTLSGTTLKSTVVNSSLTSVGMLAGLRLAGTFGVSYNYTFDTTLGNYLRIKSDAGGASPVVIDSLGNVGIGTTAPNARLEVYGSGDPVDINGYPQLGVTGSNPYSGGSYYPRYSIGYGPFQGGFYQAEIGFKRRAFNGQDFTGNLFFATADSSQSNAAPIDRMVIDFLGNVGIGTTAPGAKLDVQGNLSAGDSKFNNSVQLTNTYNGTTQSWIWAGAANQLNLGVGAVGSVTAMVINSSGNVGIGTTTDTGSKLGVVGLVDYANNTAATAAGLTAGAFYTVTSSNPKQVAVVY